MGHKTRKSFKNLNITAGGMRSLPMYQISNNLNTRTNDTRNTEPAIEYI